MHYDSQSSRSTIAVRVSSPFHVQMIVDRTAQNLIRDVLDTITQSIIQITNGNGMVNLSKQELWDALKSPTEGSCSECKYDTPMASDRCDECIDTDWRLWEWIGSK